MGVEGVVGRELPRHVLDVVLAGGLESRRQRIEPGRFRREVALRRVRATYDQRQPGQGRTIELVLFEERIERAAIAVMPQLDAGNVVGGRLLVAPRPS
jgi:hypothetical protein